VKRPQLFGILCASLTCLMACDANPPGRETSAHTSTPQTEVQKPATYVPKSDWPRSVGQVEELLAEANRRGGELTDEEVAKLAFAARQGALSAYHALWWHHSTDGDPLEAETWFAEGVKRGEPNLLVVLANRQKAKAEGMPAGSGRTSLLRKAKRNFQAALRKKSLLTVARPSTVQEDIVETDRLLNGTDPVH